MRILITGADRPLAAAVVPSLLPDYYVRLTGAAPAPVAALAGQDYVPADFRDPAQAAPLVEGMDAILHLVPYAPATSTDPATEKHTLDTAARGTYVLLHAALKSGVRRMVLASRLDLLAAHPADALVDETWKALPETTAAGLAPYLAELTLREFARAEDIVGVCLRLGDLDDGPDCTTTADAISGIRRALEMDLTGRKPRWWLYHLASRGRFVTDTPEKAPLEWKRQEEAA